MLSPHTPIPGPTPAAAIVLTAGPTHATVLMSALMQTGASPSVFSSVFLLLELAVGVAEFPVAVHKENPHLHISILYLEFRKGGNQL